MSPPDQGPMERVPLRLALFGYGRMGEAVEGAAIQAGHRVVFRKDPRRGEDGDLAESGAQVAIDFSVAAAVLGNIEAAALAGLPVVVGTTGWNDDLDRAKEIVESTGTGLLHAANFALGVHIFQRAVRAAARLANTAGGYDLHLDEIHHRSKVDHPSGTAIRIAEALIEDLDDKSEWRPGPPDGTARTETLYVSSTRAGSIPGTHVVGIEGPHDRIEIRHEAHDRSVFARGAVRAAEWLHGRRGVFTIDDLFEGIDG